MSQHSEGLLCPACRVDLVMSERHGVEIDYCPRCRGVWLDRGELDKIIERSAGPPEYEREDEERRYERGEHPEAYKHRNRKSSWGELFDFD